MDYKKAVKQAKKELEKETIDKIKGYIKETLQAVEEVKADIRKSQQELKALKADLYDLENGKLNKIRERQEKDKVAKEVSKVDLKKLAKEAPSTAPFIWDTSGGTVTVTGGTINTTYASNTAYSLGDLSGTYTYNSSDGEAKCYYIR